MQIKDSYCVHGFYRGQKVPEPQKFAVNRGSQEDPRKTPERPQEDPRKTQGRPQDAEEALIIEMNISRFLHCTLLIWVSAGKKLNLHFMVLNCSLGHNN